MFKHGKPPRIRGWVNVRSRGQIRAQSRYARLVTHKLTLYDSADEDAAPLTSLSLSGGTVVDSARKREIAITTSTGDRVLLAIRSDTQYRAWAEACGIAAQTVHNFYVLVNGRIVGTGAFSDVYFGFDRETGDHVAIKVMEKPGRTAAELSYVATEARVLSFALHPNIVRCVDIFDADENLHVVMRHMAGGTLSQRLTNADPASKTSLFRDLPDAYFVAAARRNFHALANLFPHAKLDVTTAASGALCPEEKMPDVIAWRSSLARPYREHILQSHLPIIAIIMRNILGALGYLHENGVVHRDLKPDNILFSNDPDPLRWASSACVSDFGLAAYITSDDHISGVVGTPNFVAPEMLRRDENKDFVGYGPLVDLWAAGVVFYWLLTGGKLPFDGEDPVAVYGAIREVSVKPLSFEGQMWDSVSAPAKSLLRSLLNPEPSRRLSAFGALAHPYLTLTTRCPYMPETDSASDTSVQGNVARTGDPVRQEKEVASQYEEAHEEEYGFGNSAYIDDEYGSRVVNGHTWHRSCSSSAGGVQDLSMDGQAFGREANSDLGMRALTAMVAAASPTWAIAGPLGKLRAAANAVLAAARLKETLRPKSRRRLIRFGLPEHMRQNRQRRTRMTPIDKPPVGVDGIRYNVGLLGPRRSVLTERGSSSKADRVQPSRNSTSSQNQKKKSSGTRDAGTNKNGQKSTNQVKRRISRGSNSSDKFSTGNVGQPRSTSS